MSDRPLSERAKEPCPSWTTAVLAVLGDWPATVRCNRLEGHDGRHVFHMEWGDPTANDAAAQMEDDRG